MEPTPASPPSEAEVEDLVDSSSSSESSDYAPTEDSCQSLPHIYDEDAQNDTHLFDHFWYDCARSICPHRYNGVPIWEGDSYPRSFRWSHISSVQEDPDFLAGVNTVLPVASDTPYTTPLPSPPLPQIILTPATPEVNPEPVETLPPLVELAPLVPPPLIPAAPVTTTVDFSEDYLDSSHFLLSVMGDVKLDSIPSLSSANQYTDWSAKMKGYFIFMGCWDVVNGKTKRPTAADKQESWDKLDGQARGMMYMRVAQSFHYILDAEILDTVTTSGSSTTTSREQTAADMWKSLKDKFGTPNSAHVWGQFETLVAEPRMNEQKSLQDQMMRIVNRMDDITKNKVTLSAQMKALLLLSKIPESYRSMISALMATIDVDKVTVEDIMSKTLAEESLRKAGQSANRVSQTKPKPKGPCSHCGGSNHHESNCWDKHPEKKPKGKGKGKGKAKDKDKDKDKGNNKDNQPHAHTVVESQSVNVVASSNIVGSFYPEALVASSENWTAWLMDSGASQHITGDLGDFSEYQPFDTPISFSTADASNAILALGKGTVRGNTWVDGNKVPISLTHVYYIPKLRGRIFSTGTIERNGYSLVQGNGKMCIFDKLPEGAVKFGSTIHIKGRKILEAEYNVLSNIYWTKLELHNGQQIHLNVSRFRTLHRRFGHVGKDALRHLPKNVRGVDSVDSPENEDEPCEGCAWGKSTRLPFPPSEKRATEPLELVHTDLDGPMRTQAIGGYKYFAGFIDD